jgi:multiple sugar transport system substrate-binding protein
MKFRKMTSALVAAASVGSLGLAATAAAPASASGVVHLTYTMWDPHEQIGYNESLKAFEKTHPNIQVTTEVLAYSAYQTKLQQEFQSGNGPDLFWINTPWLSTWIKDGYMVNMMPYVHKWHVNLGIYYPSLVALHEYKGALYGLPKDWDTIAMYTNATYLAKHHVSIPSNWSWSPTNGGSFLHTLQEATVDTHGNNALSPKFDPNSVATYGAIIENGFQVGFGNLWAENGCKAIPAAWASHVSFNTKACAAATEFINELMYKYHVVAPGTLLGTNGTSPSNQDQALFASGKAAMLMAGDWYTNPLYGLVGSKFKIGVAALPSGPMGRWSVYNGLIDGVNPHSKNLAAALEVEQWLASPSSQRIMGAGGFIWPAVKSLDPLFVKYWTAKGIPMQPFLDEAHGNVVNWPNTPGMNQALTDMGADMGPIWLGSQTLSGTTSLLQKAYGDANHDLSAAGA